MYLEVLELFILYDKLYNILDKLNFVKNFWCDDLMYVILIWIFNIVLFV